MAIASINPATEEVMARFDACSPEVVNRALDEARAAFMTWRGTSFAERAALVRRAAGYLRVNKG